MRRFAYESKPEGPRPGRRVFVFIGIVLPAEPVQERSVDAGQCRALVRDSRQRIFLQERQPSHDRADKDRSRRALGGYLLLLCIVPSGRGPGASATPVRDCVLIPSWGERGKNRFGGEISGLPVIRPRWCQNDARRSIAAARPPMPHVRYSSKSGN
jgi:hypothetical protein